MLPSAWPTSALALCPDLLVVDGGKPQLTAAIKQLEALGLDIPVCGLAKADEEVFVPWDETPRRAADRVCLALSN